MRVNEKIERIIPDTLILGQQLGKILWALIILIILAIIGMFIK